MIEVAPLQESFDGKNDLREGEILVAVSRTTCRNDASSKGPLTLDR